MFWFFAWEACALLDLAGGQPGIKLLLPSESDVLTSGPPEKSPDSLTVNIIPYLLFSFPLYVYVCVCVCVYIYIYTHTHTYMICLWFFSTSFEGKLIQCIFPKIRGVLSWNIIVINFIYLYWYNILI